MKSTPFVDVDADAADDHSSPRAPLLAAKANNIHDRYGGVGEVDGRGGGEGDIITSSTAAAGSAGRASTAKRGEVPSDAGRHVIPGIIRGWTKMMIAVAALLLLLAASVPLVSASASPPAPAVVPHGSILNGDGDGEASSSSLTSDEGWRELLPQALRKRRTLHRLYVEGCEVYLLGTAHVSRTSCDDVGELMKHLRPDCLFLELCPQRIAILSPTPAPEPGGSSPSLLDSIRNLQQTQGMSRTSAASAALLTKIQADYADKLGVTIGEEFREAFRHAAEQTAAAKRRQLPHVASSPWLGPTSPPSPLLESASMSPPACRVVLGDRPVRITLTRSWESLSLWGKTKLVAALLWSSIRSPDVRELEEFFDSILNDGNSTDLLTKSIEELNGSFPTIGRTVIDERDAYMHAKLRQTVRTFGARRMVAVVGAGHCPGIRRLAGDGDDADVGSGQVASGGGHEDDDPSHVLATLVETRRCKVNVEGGSGDRGVPMGASDELRSLTTDVIELHANMD